MSHSGKFILAVLSACILFLPCTSIAQDNSNLPYMNPKLSPEQRAADLVHRMTLAEKASEMQNNSAAVPRLKIPAYQWWSEALHGVINEGVTEYPEPVGLAATFDAPGIHTMAAQIGVEGRIKHVQNAREGHTGAVAESLGKRHAVKATASSRGMRPGVQPAAPACRPFPLPANAPASNR